MYCVCPLSPAYVLSLAGPQEGQILSLEGSVMEVIQHTCQICGTETSGGDAEGDLESESKMTKRNTNRRDKFSNMIILSGHLTKSKCSLGPRGNDPFKKQTGEL